MSDSHITLIRASAGSGKTWRLTEEYVSKLSQIRASGDNDSLAAIASGILAITFTNATANEMRGRVIRRLKETALGNDQKAAQSALRWLDIFLKDLGSLNIRTIDSLLHLIVRASALDLGIYPDFDVDLDVKNALAPHIELMLEQAKHGGSGRDLIAKACNAVITKGKEKGFTGKGKLLDPLQDVLEATLAGKFDGLAEENEIEELRERLRAQTQAAAKTLLDLANDANLAFSHVKNKEAVECYANGDRPGRFPAAATKKNASELFKKGDIPPELEQAYLDFKYSVEKLHFEGEILNRGLRMKPFIDLARLVAQDFINSHTEHGLVVQSMMAAWAGRALECGNGVSDALCRMGSRLSHYLVDEFQDTSREQWQVLQPLALEAIARGGSLTCVGDIKQSIYSWRGGDSRLFEEPVRDGQLTAVVTEPEIQTLGSNWRSQKRIVEHNNTFFAPLSDKTQALEIAAEILGNDSPEPVREDFCLRLANAFGDVAQECENRDGFQGFVAAEEVDGNRAEQINERICQLLLDDIGKRRPWSDVLILVRSNPEAAAMAALLGEERIPVITENGLLLNENALVIQLIAFLEFLDNPGNEIAFWTLINGEIFARHPLAASLPDLANWAAARDPKKRLYRQFADDFPAIWAELLSPFLYSGGLLTAYDTLQEWYGRMDLERRFPEDTTMLRRLLETAHLAENNGIPSIAAFLSYWEKNSAEEKAPMPEGMNAVRIMTVHKAKGLQAPVVIVAGCDYKVEASNTPAPIQVENLTVAASCVREMGSVWHSEIMRQSLEALNLLYVAFTRPREELYLLFRQKINKKTLYGITRKLIEKAGLQLPYSLGERRAADPGHKLELTSPAAPSHPTHVISTEENWRPMSWLPRLKIYHTELASPTLTPKQRGVFLHSCLEYMNYGGDPAGAAAAALKSALSACSIAVPESELPGILQSLTWFATAAPVRDWLARGWREQPLVDSAGNQLRVDLIVPEAWGPLVIDYKSGDPRPADIDQIRAYMKVLAQSGHFHGKPRGLLVYLDKQAFRKVNMSAINLVKNIPSHPPLSGESGLVPDLPPLP